MNFKKYLILTILFCIIFYSCRVTQYTQVPVDDTENITIDTIKNVYSPSYKTIFLKANCELISNDNSNSFNVNIAIVHDSIIWISGTLIAGIEAFRALFTIDSIRVINRLNKEYYALTYKDINDKMGVCLNFNILEAMITANDFKSYEKEILQKNIDTSYSEYIISQIININNNTCHFLQKTNISLNNNKILKNEFIYYDKSTLDIVFNYNEYLDQDSLSLPKQINIDIKSIDSLIMQLIISIKQIRINQPIATPFNKPNWSKSID